MFNFTGFSEKANTALNNAVNCAEDMGHTYIGSEHILAGLLKEPSSVAGVILNARKVLFSSYCEAIGSAVGIGIPTRLTDADITPRGKKILRNAMSVAAIAHSALTGTEHVLTALLKEPQCFACRLLVKMGFSPSDIYVDMLRSSSDALRPGAKEKMQRQSRLPTLERYGRNLTFAASCGRIDPVAGRKQEIDRLVKILSRRTKNNPCLIGEPGVGKTAIVEGLALRIAAGEAPDGLKNVEIYSLELTGMVAGAKYRGDFEERIKNAVNEVIDAGNIVLFIDEIHNLIGAGAAEGAVDAANILKPVLARGEIKLIGATTLEEYRKNIEKDAALERRFQTVNVEEPTTEQTLDILYNLRPRYEAFHCVKISDEALKAAVELSVRYIPDRFLPDKAIDLMDEASAGVSISGMKYPPAIKELEKKVAAAGKNKESAVNLQDFETAASYRDEEKLLLRNLCAEKAKWSENSNIAPREVKEEDISAVVSEWTKIPTGKLRENERDRLKNLENILSEKIVGQPEAVKAVSAAIRRGRAGLKNSDRPMGSFLFCGPTGVGKTALAKYLAPAVFGDKNALIKLDMSEYSEKYAVSRLIGPPPGYVGFDGGGQLVKKIRNKPYSVLLFDEIEKAHPDMFNFLLPVLEEGVLTASDGKKADCRNCIVILTSNAGARLIGDRQLALGFYEENEEKDASLIKSAVEKELKKIFPPEFLNRIDETVVFSRLKTTDIEKITGDMVEEIKERLAVSGVEAEFSNEVYSYLASRGYDKTYGARYLRRLIINEIEDPISGFLIDADKKIKKISCTVAGGGLNFAIEN